MDCGPSCLRMIAKFYGRSFSLNKLKELSETTRSGSNLYSLSSAAEKIQFRTLGGNVDFSQLQTDVLLPCIAHWKNNHFVVVYKISPKTVYVADPAHGHIELSHSEFNKGWRGETETGIVLLLEPNEKFLDQENTDTSEFGLGLLWGYVKVHKKFLAQLIFGIIAVSLIQLIFPFLTQSVVDVGISNKDLHFITLLFFAQIFLFIGRVSVEAVRSWILLHLSTRINVALVSDFFIKLMKLPIGYFDTKMTGDIMQRINDHSRVEKLLTSTSLCALFSCINLLIFGLVLLWYNASIFFVFAIGTLIYVGWVVFFLKKRKELDYKHFTAVSTNQSKVMEMINGMQEIKLHNAERQKRWDWERIQARLFRVSTQALSLEQTQTIGASFINEMKNIAITIIAATLVIHGELTLGMMLSISYILGQLNGPVQQLLGFVHSFQDATISIERIGEIHSKVDEEHPDVPKISEIPNHVPILIKNLSFRYLGTLEPVLENVFFEIPANKTTAIVGVSGSGKTTLLKLLLKFYEPSSGEIRVGNIPLTNISQHEWRKHCGVVMQEGHIFNDTIANNIAIGSERVDVKKLTTAIELSNLAKFVETLPHSYNTKIGNEGVGLSTGQKQRILIARAIYKDPKIILFDEATSSLDAINEKEVIRNLQSFFKGRTTVIIAHRLSTVQHADQIIVVGNNTIVETGNHETLMAQKGPYYNLIRNQLQLKID
jgi:ATP-binding cassette subfamily B protein